MTHLNETLKNWLDSHEALLNSIMWEMGITISLLMGTPNRSPLPVPSPNSIILDQRNSEMVKYLNIRGMYTRNLEKLSPWGNQQTTIISM